VNYSNSIKRKNKYLFVAGIDFNGGVGFGCIACFGGGGGVGGFGGGGGGVGGFISRSRRDCIVASLCCSI
jgi:hypothetical protein